ncbi:MAG TPA: hypothetical protein VMV71_00965 [Candidatus Paceibacterota bacterium]|nr:hypothetical protein [Candidatus Paceibacterota bacterium]
MNPFPWAGYDEILLLVVDLLLKAGGGPALEADAGGSNPALRSICSTATVREKPYPLNAPLWTMYLPSPSSSTV